MSATAATIITLGGGGFSDSDDGSSLIDDHIIELSGKSKPRVCFVPTASGDSVDYCKQFESAFADRAVTSVLSLFCNEPWGYLDPAMLLEQDIVYVGGGSTANLLAVWRLHGVPEILFRAAADGTVLAGISAGMNCWFEQSSTDSYGPLRPLNDGLGFLEGSACPHYLGEVDRRDKYLAWVGDGTLSNGYAVDEYAAIVWRDGQPVDAICEQPNRPIRQVCRTTDGAVERDLSVRMLS